MSEPSTETPQKPVDEQPPSSSSPAPESSTDKPIEDKASSKYQQQQQPTRKRTRATAEQLAVLEDTFAVNVSPNSKLRKQLAEQLKMSERSIQIWFQNRRAKVKHMQKRAQIQMQQASIRAQLYHYHQQHYGSHPYGGPPLMPLPQQHHHAAPHPYYRPYTPAPPGPVARLPAVSRAQSVDAINHQRASSAPTVSVPPSTVHPLHTTTNVTPPPSHIHSSWPLQTSSITAPQHSSSSPSTSSPHLSLSQSIAAEPAMPALVSVPDAGPTAMLASTSSSTCSSSTSSSSCSQPATSASELGYAPSTPAATPPSALNHHHAAAAAAIAHNDLWCSPDEVDHLGRAQSVSLAVSDPFIVCSRALSDPIVTTIDPSSLMMTPSTSASSSTSSSTTSSDSSHHQRQNSFNDATVAQQQQQQPECTQLSATTLTVGSWHRMKLRTDDLVCEYRADRHQFCWHIADNGCRFRMEIALDAVASIEYVANDCDVLADVHFDMSEPPLFYMEKNQEWIQCSDFTEGKQASRFFRHTLKGIAHHMKNDLLAMSTIHEETRRLVRFMETPAPYAAAAADMMLTAGVPPPPPPPLGPHQFYWASAVIPPPPPPPPPHMINPFVSESACGYMS